MKIMLQVAQKILCFTIISLFAASAGAEDTQPLLIHTSKGDARFTVEIARTPEQQEQGLMYRKELAPDHGMLFPLSTPHEMGMWMKNTLIPLDMFFIRADGTIARIEENATPQSLAIIHSIEPVSAVLEAPGGTAQRIGAKAGDHVVSEALK